MDKFTLVIGNKNYSSWSLRPWLLMKQAKIPFEEVIIPLFTPGYKEKILQYSPAGKVPLLKHGKITIWESVAICDYLNDIFPKKNLLPKDKKKRALARSICAEMHAGFLAFRKNCPMNVKAKKEPKDNPPELYKDVARIKAIWEECRRLSKKDGEFLFGNFTMADAMYAPIVFRFNTYGITIDGEAKKYADFMFNLPALQEWYQAALKESWVIEAH